MESRDFRRSCDLRLSPHQDETVRIEHRRGQDGAKTECRVAVEIGLADLSADNHQRSCEAQDRGEDGLFANPLPQHDARKIERDERGDEADCNRFGEGQLGDRIEECQRHEGCHHRTLQMQLEDVRLRPPTAARQPQRQRNSGRNGRAQPGRGKHAHRQSGALHEGIHQRQAGDRERRHEYRQ